MSLVILHLLFLIYSVGGIFSKLASGYTFMSRAFVLYYTGAIIMLAVYAVGWQQMIKRFPLSAAYANKAVTVIWASIWGTVFFSEKITLGKAAGIILIIIGVILYAREE